MSERVKGFICAFAHAAIIGFALYATKLALACAPTIDVLAHRFALAALSGAAFGLATHKLRFRLAHLKIIALLSLFFPIGFFFFQTWGLNYVASSQASVLISSTPVFTVILARFFLGERVSAPRALALALAVAGVALVESKGLGGDFCAWGGALIVICALSHAIYNIALKRLAKGFSAYEIACGVSVCGCVFFCSISLISHAVEGSLGAYFAAFGEPSFVWAILFLGIFSSFGSSLLLSYALARVEAGKVSVISVFSTIVALAAGVALAGEKLGVLDWIGAAMAIIGVAGFNLVENAKRREANSNLK